MQDALAYRYLGFFFQVASQERKFIPTSSELQASLMHGLQFTSSGFSKPHSIEFCILYIFQHFLVLRNIYSNAILFDHKILRTRKQLF